MNKVASLLLAVGFALPGLLEADVDTAWVRRYDGPAHGDDWATRIAVDSAGDVYVTGTSSSDTSSSAQYLDFVTIKYCPNGDTAWVRRADFGGKDIPYGLAVDPQGNVYVAGTNNDSRMVTAKYSPTGLRLWYELFGSQGGAYDLALDSQGNPIVCGGSFHSSLDATLVKYRANGDTAWARYYDWAGDEDYAMALTLDSLDGVATTGYGAGTSTHYDCITVKCDSLGGRLWTLSYDGPQHGDDRSVEVAVDVLHDHTVTAGQTDSGYTTDLDYLTIMYDSTGETLWTRRYDGPANGDDRLVGIALDEDGCVYVTGTSHGVGRDYATVKYDPTGSRMWVARYDSPAHLVDEAYAMAPGEDRSVCVTGGVLLQPSVGACVTIRYGPDGDTVWVATYSAPPAMPNYGSAIAVGVDGCVYVAGNHGNDIMTIKYVQDGGVQEKPVAPIARLSVVATPDPMVTRTAVRFGLPAHAPAALLVLDVSGRIVRSLCQGSLPAGWHSVVWDRTDDYGMRVSAGVYMIVLDADGAKARIKVTVLK